jgi:hypothetical protein
MATVITKEAQELARDISESEKADIYLYNGPINEQGFSAIISAYSRHHPSALLLLTTNGGSANSAYRIARWFQSLYDGFGLLILSYCKSAGTLITTGAHRLILAGAGELGPLDVQLNKRDELWEQRSGLTLRNALTSLGERAEDFFSKLMMSIKANSGGSVRFKLAADLGAQLTRDLFAPIYAQITPEGLGEDYQELMVAYEYGKRLARVGGNISEEAIHRLVHEYPSHDFVIDALEAKTLFRSVEDATIEMYRLASTLRELGHVPNSTRVTAIHLSKPDEKKADEGSEKGASDSEPKTENGEGSPESSDHSAA